MAEEGSGTPQLKWTGEYDDAGKAHGQGVLQFPPPPKKDEEEEEKPGDKFEGTLQHGLRDGRGRYTWSNGSVYDGDYRAGARHGQGRMVFPDKGEYEGQWADNKPDGDGCYKYPNGDIFQGTFQQGLKHGSGSYYFKATSSQQEGTWSQGKFVQGTWMLQDGSNFKGDFSAEGLGGSSIFTASSGLCQKGLNGGGVWHAAGPLGDANALISAQH